jgi:hypothetical protein
MLNAQRQRKSVDETLKTVEGDIYQKLSNIDQGETTIKVWPFVAVYKRHIFRMEIGKNPYTVSNMCIFSNDHQVKSIDFLFLFKESTSKNIDGRLSQAILNSIRLCKLILANSCFLLSNGVHQSPICFYMRFHCISHHVVICLG